MINTLMVGINLYNKKNLYINIIFLLNMKDGVHTLRSQVFTNNYPKNIKYQMSLALLY